MSNRFIIVRQTKLQHATPKFKYGPYLTEEEARGGLVKLVQRGDIKVGELWGIARDG